MHRALTGIFSADRILVVTAPRRVGTQDKQSRPEISEALTSLSAAAEVNVAVRYAQMWLHEAEAAQNARDEIRHLTRAEQELGRAVLASASPSAELRRAFQLTMRARNEATD
jgi:hypothetical protein